MEKLRVLFAGALAVLSTAGRAQPHDMASMSAEPALLGALDAREASGTSWQPADVPVHAFHLMSNDGMLMFHGSLFAGFDLQGGARGDHEFVGIGWLMGMARKSVGTGELSARVMLSVEPFTMKASGYPLLLQTGEEVDGEPLHDRQHPHDLFMEMAATYRLAISDTSAAEVYLAAVGEPALGPTAFPHRASAESDPQAALGHHWEDSTHISFGVATLGFVLVRDLKLEASVFNGREPDDVRTNFDFRRLDSVSGRASYAFSRAWTVQASYGYLASPEEHDPDVSARRFTASASHASGFGAAGRWASTFVVGRNAPSRGDATLALLAETNLDLDGRNVVFGRAEYVQKSGRDLALDASRADRTYDVGSLVLGYLRELPLGRLRLGAGARVAVNSVPRDLSTFYGTGFPAGGMLFVRLRPAPM